MLTVPAFEYFSDLRVTAYQDDTMFWKFYLVPDYISIRKDINGNPVFLLIKYAFSDQDREENPDLPRGGGYLAFDVEMSVPEADRATLITRLQERVDEEWQRLKDLADSHGERIEGMRLSSWNARGLKTISIHDVRLGLPTDTPEAPPGDRPPSVILAQPTWTDGTFEVTAPSNTALVSERVTSGEVSLIGNNTVAVSMELTSAGATFMEKVLVDPDGSGGSDVTPIQVTYKLKHWARVPPVRLRIEVDSRSVYAAIHEIDHDYDGHTCGEDDLTHYETNLQAAVQAGMIDVRLDTGTLPLDDDFVEELRSRALGMVQDLLKDRFFEQRDEGDGGDDGDDPDFLDSKKDVYYLKQEMAMDFTRIELDETLESIVEWKANPQSTLQTFFANLSAQEVKKYVRTADLTDTFFQTLGLKIQAFADWDGEPISFVECQVRYDGVDENGVTVRKNETFTLTKDAPSAEWDPSLIGAQREYRYTYRVGFEGREPEPFPRMVRSRSPQLNLAVADPGKVAVRVLTGAVDFAQTVDKVQVDLSYEDRRSDVEEESTTLILTQGQEEQSYERYIFTEWDEPVSYRSRFFLKDGQVVEDGPHDTTNRQLLINAPLFDKLDVQLVPAGDWEGVVQSIVNLRYDDPDNDYHADAAFALKGLNEFKAWGVVLRDPDRRIFEHRVVTTFADGQVDEGEWTESDGDQALPIVVRAAPRLSVQLLPNLLDFGVTPVVQCTLRYDDPDAGIHRTETFPFTAPEPVKWSLPLADAERRSYRQQLTYHTDEGDQVNRPEATSDLTSLVIPRLKVPEVVLQMVPRLVDFTATPVVEVNLEYRDPANDIDDGDTLIFTERQPQTFRLRVAEDSPREITLTLTYFLEDGEVVVRDPVTVTKKRFTIPRFVAET